MKWTLNLHYVSVQLNYFIILVFGNITNDVLTDYVIWFFYYINSMEHGLNKIRSKSTKPQNT